METISTSLNPGDIPPPPFLANMGLAQIQALGLLGYFPTFAPMHFLPPNLNQGPLDLSKSGYEATVKIMTPLSSQNQETQHDSGDMDTSDSSDNSNHVQLLNPDQSSNPGSPDQTKHTERKPIQERVRQKRQTLQDMTRPLKHWLYNHRENPYPSKADKVHLARSSQMTMTQVSNWFANARRRLKNTVRGPELTWAKRIKLYNTCVEGNQELLSIGSSSDDDLSAELGSGDGDSENPRIAEAMERLAEERPMISESNSALLAQNTAREETLQDRLQGEHNEHPPQLQPFNLSKQSQMQTFSTLSQDHPLASPTMPNLDNQQPPTDAIEIMKSAHENLQATISGFSESDSLIQESCEGPPKYKNTIMQRYLTDSLNSYHNALLSLSSPEKERHRNPSGSLSSHDYEEYMSSASSARSTPTRDQQVDGHVDQFEEFSRHWPDIKSRAEEDIYWKEISAAMALTSLARAHYPTQVQHTAPSTQ